MALTNEDKKWIGQAVVEIVRGSEERMKQYVDEKVANLPDKDLFLDRTDQILGHDRKTDEELVMISQRISTLEQEMERLKQLVEKK